MSIVRNNLTKAKLMQQNFGKFEPIKQKDLEARFINQEEAKKIPYKQLQDVYFTTEELKGKSKDEIDKMAQRASENKPNKAVSFYIENAAEFVNSFGTAEYKPLSGQEDEPRTWYNSINSRIAGWNSENGVKFKNGTKKGKFYPANRIRLSKFKEIGANRFIIAVAPDYDSQQEKRAHMRRQDYYQMVFEQKSPVALIATNCKRVGKNQNTTVDLLEENETIELKIGDITYLVKCEQDAPLTDRHSDRMINLCSKTIVFTNKNNGIVEHTSYHFFSDTKISMAPSEIANCLKTLALLNNFIEGKNIKIDADHPLISMCNTGKDRSVFAVIVLDLLDDIGNLMPDNVNKKDLDVLLSKIDFHKILYKEASIMQHETVDGGGLDGVCRTILSEYYTKEEKGQRNSMSDEEKFIFSRDEEVKDKRQKEIIENFNRDFKKALIEDFELLTGYKLKKEKEKSAASLQDEDDLPMPLPDSSGDNKIEDSKPKLLSRGEIAEIYKKVWK